MVSLVQFCRIEETQWSLDAVWIIAYRFRVYVRFRVCNKEGQHLGHVSGFHSRRKGWTASAYSAGMIEHFGQKDLDKKFKREGLTWGPA